MEESLPSERPPNGKRKCCFQRPGASAGGHVLTARREPWLKTKGEQGRPPCTFGSFCREEYSRDGAPGTSGALGSSSTSWPPRGPAFGFLLPSANPVTDIIPWHGCIPTNICTGYAREGFPGFPGRLGMETDHWARGPASVQLQHVCGLSPVLKPRALNPSFRIPEGECCLMVSTQAWGPSCNLVSIIVPMGSRLGSVPGRWCVLTVLSG